MEERMNTLQCNKRDNPNDPCKGPVEYRLRPTDWKQFPYCEHHFEQSQKVWEHAQELMSPIPAPWFDPSYAGESWDEE